ncbi:recombinase family protein [Catenulispora sp. NF23]|uniref:recombinase family protein n=1 Tax=Catenulispora pinistramenti TaxID=2705254 RepID=UPI001BA5A748|nr:recombinase family protein [Catenulispora pinistramenti]MBS2538394.1 recombinase family protein [Catenulispora pinistramenti]
MNLIDVGASRLARNGLRFAFYGRVSTEDNQDPEASRNWQRSRALTLIEPVGGEIVVEFFDIGMSRSLPWTRRPRANDLLMLLEDRRNRGFDAIVIGEPQRAFYGSQYSMTMPVLTHYGATLWVPEVGGAIDPDSEAHDLIMSVFGGMSKGERNRVKIRVRSAMSSQAKIEGRFLGGRPPYGYQLADLGRHPNPAKAADGKRLHGLEPHPDYAPVVKRIFAEYLRGRGFYAIAEGLTRDGILSPSQADPQRNSHRTGEGWSKGAVKAILENPRYTGRQVWNKQRKDEVLLDVKNVEQGYETKLRWNDEGSWVWSDKVVHEPLVSVADFEATKKVRAAHGHDRTTRERTRTQHFYVFKSRLWCGLCGRKMQGQQNHGKPNYRCRYPKDYALANHVQHPDNVYVKEEDVLPVLDQWLLKLFAPHRIGETIRTMADNAAALTEPATAPEPDADAAAKVAKCDTKLEAYRKALEAGADPVTVSGWIAEVNATRAAALASSATGRARANPQGRLSEEAITLMIQALGDIRKVIEKATIEDKARVYDQLGLRLTYAPGAKTVRVEMNLNPNRGVMVSVRGGT